MLSLMAGVAFLTHFALVHRLKLSITHMEGGQGYFGMWDVVLLRWDFWDLYTCFGIWDAGFEPF